MLMPLRRRSLIAAALPLAAAACSSSPDAALYNIAIRSGTPRPGGPKVVQLREVGVARYLDRKEVVRSSDGYKLDVAANDWWGEPLNTMLSRVLVVALSRRLPDSNVYAEGGPISADANAVLAVNFQRLDVDQRGMLELLAQVAVEFNRPRRSSARTFTIAKPLAAATVAGQVAAISDAVGELCDGVAALLQS
jgi:uncharacterized lipoprotein YmbA